MKLSTRFLGLAIAAISQALATATPVEPNIVIMLADDMNWRDSSAYFDLPGGIPSADMPAATTPNMEALASEGLRFNFCFSASGMCAPLRQQLYTGIFPVRNGAHANHSKIKTGLPTLPGLLQAEGYRVGIMGKRHINTSVQFPFELVAGVGVASESDTEDPANIAAAEHFVTRDPEEPYCLLVTSNNPHGPYTHGNFVPDDTTLPVSPDYVDTPEFRENYNGLLGEVKAFDDEVGHWMNFIATQSPNPDNTIFIVLTEQGASIPAAKWTCYDLGLRSGCIVRWPAAVAPATTTDAMVEYVDIIPTILQAIAKSRGESTYMPTGLDRLDGRSFLGVLEGERTFHKKYVYGVQTTKEVTGAPDIGYACRSIRGERYKLIWNLQHEEEFTPGTSSIYKSWVAKASDSSVSQEERDHAQRIVDRYTARPEYQFFDFQTDPYELESLHDQPADAGEIAHLKELLERFMASQRDRGIASEQTVDRTTWPQYDEVHPYTAWTMMFPFVSVAELGPDQDPDGDDRNNETEWIDGTHPLIADSPDHRTSIAAVPGGPNLDLTLSFPRPVHHDSFGISYKVEGSTTLGDDDTWSPVDVSPGAFPTPMDDGFLELAHLTLTEDSATTPRRFYRIGATVLSDYPGPPATLLDGSGPTPNLGDLSSTLNNQDFTLTLETVLPAGPVVDPDSGEDRARVLIDLGGSTGISLVLLNDRLILSASNGSAAGQIWNELPLDPSDFGKPIQIRIVTIHDEAPPEAPSYLLPRGTLFELSYRVTGGTSARNGVALVTGLIGYVGSGGSAIGHGTGDLTGLSGTAFGPLASLPNGFSDVQDWETSVTYQSVEGTMALFSNTIVKTPPPPPSMETVIALSNSWDSDSGTTPGLSNESSNGYSLDLSSATSGGNNRVFQRSPDFQSADFNVGDTLTWSFNVKADTIDGGSSGDRDFRFSIADADGNGLSCRVDWGDVGSNTMLLGYNFPGGSNASGITAGQIGGRFDNVSGSGDPNPGLANTTVTVPIRLVATRTAANTVEATLNYGDASLSGTFANASFAFDAIELLGIRMATGDPTDAFMVSNMSAVLTHAP